jgi:heat shock protein 1/8
MQTQFSASEICSERGEEALLERDPMKPKLARLLLWKQTHILSINRSYDSVSSTKVQFDSAPLVKGPNGEPAFKVKTHEGEKIFTAQEITTKYLSSLIGFASDYLGRPIDAAVFAVPSFFTPEQYSALEKAAKDAAGVNVLQFLQEPAAAAVAYNLTVPNLTTSAGEATAPVSKSSLDRNVVVLDVGATTTTATVLAAREGAYVPLAVERNSSLGGESFDEGLITFFSKEFTKKTKAKLVPSNHRAMMKLRLACETVKRTLSASTSAACSIESLSEGLDFSGSINRTRFDLLSSNVYEGIIDVVRKALSSANLDSLQVQEVILVGGTCKNPTVADKLSAFFPENTSISTQVDADQAIAKGCALQANLLTKLNAEEAKYISSSSSLSDPIISNQQVTSAPIGLLVPAPSANGSSSSSAPNPAVIDGKIFVTIIEANTPLPARRIFELPFAKSASNVKLAIYEGAESIHVEAPPAKDAKKSNGNAASDDEDDYSDDEDEEIKTLVTKPTTQLANIVIPVKGSGKQDTVRLSIVVTKDGKVEIEAGQTGSSDVQKVQL